MSDVIFWSGFGLMMVGMLLHYVSPLGKVITNAVYGVGLLVTAYATAISPRVHGWEDVVAPSLLGGMGVLFILVDPVRNWLEARTKEESNGKSEAGEGQGDVVLPEGAQGSED